MVHTKDKNEEGWGLVEALVAVLLVSITAVFLMSVLSQQRQASTRSERVSVTVSRSQAILAQARQADYADLGYYAGDDGFDTSPVRLPLGTIDEPAGTVIEEPVVLDGPVQGERASSFPVKPVTEFTAGKSAFRVTTFITHVPAPPGQEHSLAKRITVMTQWGPTSMAGNFPDQCDPASSECTIQTMVRSASGSDVNPVDGKSGAASSTCSSGPFHVCEMYVRSGRVLDGSTMATDMDVPILVRSVDLRARTSAPATSMTATWTLHVPNGSGGITTRNVSVPLTSKDGGTRWEGKVDADIDPSQLATDPSAVTPSQLQGRVRPGSFTVTFTAQVGAVSTVRDTEAFWAYQIANQSAIDHVTATLAPSQVTNTTWCSPTGSGTPLNFTVTGHSVGFKTGTVPNGARDKVHVLFTTRSGSTTTTTKVPATLVTTRDVTENIGNTGTIVKISADADWRVTAPATQNCQVSSTAVVVVERALDRSTTTIPLTLAAN